MIPIDNSLDKPRIEKEILMLWNRQSQEYFKPDEILLLPPPNITGKLHVGHALTSFIQDTIVKGYKMKGKRVIWIPGVDHAGISIQVVLEKKLFSEFNKKRWDMSISEWDIFANLWKEKITLDIESQLKRLGLSLDWKYKYYTLDSLRSSFVKDAFIRLYEDGLIYQTSKLVNWCPTLRSTISDIEVDTVQVEPFGFISLPDGRKTQAGIMYMVKFPLASQDDFISVGTSRPETLFGDVAIALHSTDQRLKYSQVFHPILKKFVPLISDDKLVSLDIGTGAVKVTPGHDKSDYECALRHFGVNGCSFIDLFDDSGIIKKNVLVDSSFDHFLKLDRWQLREAVVDHLKKQNLLLGMEGVIQNIPICSKTGDVIERRLLPQWFLKTKPLTDKLLSIIKREGDNFKVYPESSLPVLLSWFDKIEDWCLSRQLWWGHKIPLYYHNSSIFSPIAANSVQEAKAKLDIDDDFIKEETDVLDTWFSSCLLPISATNNHYPLSILETGSDILFFWVARMLLLCTYLNGNLPFKKILLHGMVRDANGIKMSKTVGNTINPSVIMDGCNDNGEPLDEYSVKPSQKKTFVTPLKTNNTQSSCEISERVPDTKETILPRTDFDVKEGFGSDSLRMALLSNNFMGVDISFSSKNLLSARSFEIKIINALKWILSLEKRSLNTCHSFASMQLVEQFVYLRLGNAIKGSNESSEVTFELDKGLALLNEFFLNTFCGTFIEVVKNPLFKGSIFHILNIFIIFLKSLFPYCPFLTEFVWQVLRESPYSNISNLSLTFQETLSQAFYTEPELKYLNQGNDRVEETFSNHLRVVSTIRSLMGSISPLKVSEILINYPNLNLHTISSMTGVEKITIGSWHHSDKMIFTQCVLLSKEPFFEITKIGVGIFGTIAPQNIKFIQILKKQENELVRCLKQLESTALSQDDKTVAIKNKFKLLVQEMEEKIKCTKRNISLL